MKNKILITILFTIGIFSIFTSSAQDVDDTFNYQGMLLDNGSPANDAYDITVQGYILPAGLITLGNLSTHLNVNVENGLFTLEAVDLDGMLDGADVYFEISVRKSSVGGAYTALSPRQKMKAVPYASSLTANGAGSGQVLTYDGTKWLPITPTGSPWMLNGSNISFTAGRVGIGREALLSDLEVEGQTRFYGSNQMYNAYYENGVYRGYVGSWSGNAEDFEIGTGGGNLNGSLHLSIQGTPKVTVSSAGDTSFEGNTKQSDSKQGMLKYMVNITCPASGSATVNRSYNGTTTAGNVTVGGEINIGQCTLTFPTAINTRYWVATAVAGFADVGVVCSSGSANELTCRRFDSSTGNGSAGQFNLLIY